MRRRVGSRSLPDTPSDRQLLDRLARDFRRALNGSLSDDRIYLVSFDAVTGGYISTNPTATPIPLSNDVSLAVQHWAKPALRAGQKKLRTIGYSYQVLVSSRPLLEFHYHPGSAVKHCHVHVRADSKDWASLRKVHVATGRVALEDVLLMLIDDFELPSRKGARALLRTQRAAFDRRQTWGGAQPPA